ncbi:hypothetical protein MTBBW1_600047 [Desulfamplus magnetovallimortis]|uniref:Uncharacterized protein n=1 Tax=Desulfamplus magnetovallimortis TaxID=1246637 RepID=A0A1W1HI82_9BACT|nr:hypothetical protein MTBBW1_600047 [Desulfamplus magnetovallimortis]
MCSSALSLHELSALSKLKIRGWCPKYVDELFTNLDSVGLSQKDINTFMTLPIRVRLIVETRHALSLRCR